MTEMEHIALKVMQHGQVVTALDHGDTREMEQNSKADLKLFLEFVVLLTALQVYPR